MTSPVKCDGLETCRYILHKVLAGAPSIEAGELQNRDRRHERFSRHGNRTRRHSHRPRALAFVAGRCAGGHRDDGHFLPGSCADGAWPRLIPCLAMLIQSGCLIECLGLDGVKAELAHNVRRHDAVRGHVNDQYDRQDTGRVVLCRSRGQPAPDRCATGTRCIEPGRRANASK
jgi:hypothetical protein